MYASIILQMREKVRALGYVMTIHAEEEMEEDDFTIFDVENGILSGEIVERQEDYHSGEWKYVVIGSALDGRMISIVAKLSATGKLVIITVYYGY